jgi:hypothetical protein
MVVIRRPNRPETFHILRFKYSRDKNAFSSNAGSLTLRGVDRIVFVADSQYDATEENLRKGDHEETTSFHSD